METKRLGVKCCPKCGKTDETEFRKCRFCGTRYDAKVGTNNNWIGADLNYAAPLRRLLGHMLDGIIGTLVVGVIWIGLCLTGSLAIVMEARGAIGHEAGEPAAMTTLSRGGEPEGPKQVRGTHNLVETRSGSKNREPKPPHLNGSKIQKTHRGPGAGKASPGGSITSEDPFSQWLPGYDGDGLNESLQFPVFMFTLLYYVLMWFYTAGFQSSTWQATPGQALVGCKMTDVVGDRISFTRASVRYFASLVSDCFGFVGYILIFCTDRKQTLHDMISGCVVLVR